MKKEFIKIGLLLILVLFVTGCGNKYNSTNDNDTNTSNKALTADNFKEKLNKEKKYLITDDTDLYKKQKFVKKVYIASDKDSNYQVVFYEFDNYENSINFYNDIKKLIKEDESDYTDNEDNQTDHNKYILESSDNYYVLSQIDNTVVYVSTLIEYKNQVNTIIEKINY